MKPRLLIYMLFYFGNTSPENQPVCPLEVSSQWTSKRKVPQRRLVAIQRKLRDDLHDSAVQCVAGTLTLFWTGEGTFPPPPPTGSF